MSLVAASLFIAKVYPGEKLQLHCERRRDACHSEDRQALAKIHTETANPALADRVGGISRHPRSWADDQVLGFVGRRLAEKSGREAVCLFVLA